MVRVAGSIVPSISVSLESTLSVIGVATVAINVSSLAVGAIISLVSKRTLSRITLALTSPKPSRSKYSFACVPGAMLLTSIVNVSGESRVRVLLAIALLLSLTNGLKYALPSDWMLSKASVEVSPDAVPARGARVWASSRATSKASAGLNFVLAPS